MKTTLFFSILIWSYNKQFIFIKMDLVFFIKMGLTNAVILKKTNL